VPRSNLPNELKAWLARQLPLRFPGTQVAILREKNKKLQKENTALRQAGSKPKAAGDEHQSMTLPASPQPSPGRIQAQHVSSQKEGARVAEAEAIKATGLGSPIDQEVRRLAGRN
jgi:hypothetical protein